MDIGAWLRALGLQQYEQSFRDNAIDPEVLPALTEADLEKLDVLLGHRKKMLAAIAKLGKTRLITDLPRVGEDRFAISAAERRQLTVMFCDLVGSTELASRLDPEDLRAIIGAYYRAIADTVAPFDGFVARYMGDGALVYFGYPCAHEDDAEQAVRAALALIGAAQGIRAAGEKLRLRIGIATGLALVGDLIGTGAEPEETVVGETPNLAARLQTLAEPDTVLIADGTRRLVGSLFDLIDLGPRELRGFAQEQRVWRVAGASTIESRFEALRSKKTPLVGREEELELLLRRWSQSQAREGQVVLLSGEPGIGKSRLTAALQEHLARVPHTCTRHFCSPHHEASALFPFIGQLERAAHFTPDDPPGARLEKLASMLQPAAAEGDISLIAELMSVPGGDHFPPLVLSPQRKKERIFAALLGQLDGLARSQPLLMIFEDLHWIDPTSRELLDLVVARVERLPVLLLVTYRPEFEVAWTDQLHVTFIALNRLGLSASAALVRRLAGENGGLPEDVVDEIVARTDGVPLFIEELTKHVLETGIPGEQTNRPRSGTRGVPRIPATLHDSLMARLDRLAWAKELAQAASALGRHFPRALIAAITDDSPIRLQEGLDRLTEAQLVFGHGAGEAASYTFRHALVQDAAYGSMLRPRRRSLHRRIAEALETAFPEIAEAHPEAIGHHLTEAQLIDKAIPWWRRAGQKNAHASANVEAIVHFERCLGLLSALPEGSERDSTELDIRIDLSTALAGVSGYTSDEWKINSARLGELCDRVDVPNKLFPALWGQWVETFSAAEMGKATPMAERLLDVAQRHDNRVHLMVGHRVLGMSLVGLGQVAAARPHLEQAASLYDPRRDAELAYVYAVDQRLSALAYLCIALLQLGELPRATSLLGETITDAMALDQANTICFVLSLGACFHLLRRDFESLRGCSTQLERTAEKHSQTARALLARTINRLLAARTGGDIAVLGEITQGIVQLQAMNWGFWIPWLLLLDAEVRHTASSGREALALIERAECFIEPRSYGLCLPELYRLRAHFAASKGEPDEVIEAHYQRSIRIAGSQFALLPQLRSASELARYWRDRGKSREARAVLAGVLSRVGEGFDKKELMRARDVLTSLS